jgi:C1A family cysteine protease
MKAFSTLAFLGAVSASQLSSKFMQYVSTHGKSYATVEEFEFRKALFAKRDEEFAAINNNSSNTFTVGHNKFSDMTPQEFKKMLGYIAPVEVPAPTYLPETNADVINWVTKGAVSAVKDQGQCGSCWAFSSTGALEAAHWIKSGESLLFSEQQLVDCVNLALGCNGGNQSTAFRYLAKNANAVSEANYPYKALTQTCTYNAANATKVNVVSQTHVPGSDIA